MVTFSGFAPDTGTGTPFTTTVWNPATFDTWIDVSEEAAVMHHVRPPA
jgi:hypothetical protein